MPTKRKKRPWRDLAAAQAGLITRAQLNELGWDHDYVRNQIRAERWVARSSVVISTTTGTPTREQTMWCGVLHAGGSSLVGDLTAAEVAGLTHWERDEITILVSKDAKFDDSEVDGVRFVRTRRPLALFRRRDLDLPVARVEPAVLHFAAYQRSRRTAQGVVAATVQQRLSTPDAFLRWLPRMRPLRWSRIFEATLAEIAGGAQSVAELDVTRMCRAHGLALPQRQTKRRDSEGHVRFTDCEWRLPDGTTLVLEVEGGFHMDVEQWEDDIARQRRLTTPGRLIVRCTSRELRDDSDQVARDLLALGVPRAAA